MTRYVTTVLGLALGVAICAAGQQAQAKGRTRYAFPYDRVAAANESYGQMQPSPENWVQGDSMDDLPIEGAGPGMNGHGTCGCNGGGCQDGYCDAPCGGEPCDYGCYEGCGWSPCDDMLYGGWCGSRCGRLYIGADYLYVRASGSHITDYDLITTFQGEGTLTRVDEIHQQDFQHESSYRLHGGYELGNCGEELRFTFTRFNSFANTAVTAPQDPDIVVFCPCLQGDVDPGTPLLVNTDVDLKTYDLELSKTIPLGGTAACNGSCGCGCGDACDGGCGCGGCASCCPTWDITWSGGIRFADADWRRTCAASVAEGEPRTLDAALYFEGGGPRMGLEGRRYFGCTGIFSAFLRGDLSLLLGHRQSQVVRTSEDGAIIDIATANTRNVIPVTDLESGMTLQVTCFTRLSAGYLFSAWHDLGFQDDNFNDANILAFDGLFVRLEGNF